MEAAADLDELVAHLERTTRMNPTEARRLVAEVVTYFSDTIERFVRRRHQELQVEQYKNDEIFERIAAELCVRRFAAPPLSARQIRRLIYG
jgi:hypothetical protein